MLGTYPYEIRAYHSNWLCVYRRRYHTRDLTGRLVEEQMRDELVNMIFIDDNQVPETIVIKRVPVEPSHAPRA